MPALHHLLALTTRFGTAWILLLAVIARLAVLSSPKGSEPRGRFRFAFSLYLLHVFVLLASTALHALGSNLLGELVVAVGLTATLAGVALGSVLVFEGIVRRVRPSLPRIVPDVLTTIAAFVGAMRASSSLGVELSGVIATSAVATAVIGLSLQDTLGNVLGGLALQLDNSIQVGDWVRFADVTGKVVEIRWRYTAIETRNWETVIVPNSMLTRTQVVVLGRRRGQPVQLRRFINFQVDFRTAPNDVVETVERALRAQPIPNVAANPPPNCVALEIGDSSIQYAARYWLTDFVADNSTDSLVRTRIFYALARAGYPLSIPAQTVFMTEEDSERAASKSRAEHARRMAALAQVVLFADVADEDREKLASSLHRAPFAEGETLTREGAEAHHLYAIVEGHVSIRVGGFSAENEVARLGPGDFFGEMALLTGEKRRATTVALTEVDCYRLDAGAFRALLQRRPELAERVAKVLVEREAGLQAHRKSVGEEQHARLLAQNERALVGKIRAFFQLD